MQELKENDIGNKSHLRGSLPLYLVYTKYGYGTVIKPPAPSTFYHQKYKQLSP